MKKRILVTGSCGYIGSRLCSELSKEDVELYTIDLCCGQDVLTSELPDVDIVYHLAAQTGAVPSMNDPLWDARNNILGTIRVAKRYAGTGTKIIYTTSGGAIVPESPYGLSKKTGEEYLKMLCPEQAVICRLSSVYGEKDRGVVDTFIREKKCVIFGDGSAVRDFVHVNDVVQGLLKARGWKPRFFSLGSGKGVTVIEIALATRKTIEGRDPRKGEKHSVVLRNTTPDWEPTIDVLEYVRSEC